ncbi:hypothetical protein B0H19DRAFT_1375868 [Mycena capillaripes]|nr:hypothetical protein B0H19DRAFT_1375868 [Mycena capillaripes]
MITKERKTRMLSVCITASITALATCRRPTSATYKPPTLICLVPSLDLPQVSLGYRLSSTLPMDSPFQDILHTNVAPSDSECRGILDFLEGPCKQIDDLTAELRRLESLRKELLQKRRELRKFIDAHRALLSPVRRLPEDIVGAIFLACLPSTRNPAISDREAPLLLCRICRSWRSLALATPRLWAAIHIVVPAQSQLERITNLVGIWLKRSGVVPLDISMVLSRSYNAHVSWNADDPWDADYSYDTNDCDRSQLFSALVAVSRRWKSIEIPLTEHLSGGSLFSTLTAENVPLLEMLKIGGTSKEFTLTPLNWTSVPFIASRGLRRLTIPGSHRCDEIPIAWNLLTHLKITRSDGFLTGSIALAILRQGTSLQTCELCIADGTPEGTDLLPKEDFSRPQLCHLVIKRHTSLERGNFLGTVNLPNLQSLHYERWEGVCEPNLVLLLPSTPTLECLRLSTLGTQSHTYLDILSHIPTLKALTIVGEPCEATEQPPSRWFPPPGDGKFLEHLTLSPGLDAAICPHLESVEFQHFDATADETLLQFVRSRTQPKIPNVAELTHVVVEFTRPMDFDITFHLQDAIARGLAISLKYYIPPEETEIDVSYSPWEGRMTSIIWDTVIGKRRTRTAKMYNHG